MAKSQTRLTTFRDVEVEQISWHVEARTEDRSMLIEYLYLDGEHNAGAP